MNFMSRKRLFRIILAIALLTIVIVATLAVYVVYSFYFGPLPKTSGVTTVEGLQSPVTVYRDSWAITHIYANTDEDLFFSLGYVHAQDRWWQMEISRYLGMARLRDILLTDRNPILNADRLMQTLALDEAARQEWQNADPLTRQALEAYSAGVNAYIQERDVQSLASEYGLMGFSGQFDSLLIYLGRDVEVEPWEPYHSILIWKLFALSLENDFFLAFEDALVGLSPIYESDVLEVLLAGDDSQQNNLRRTLAANDWDDLGQQRLPFATSAFMQSLGFLPLPDGFALALSAERSTTEAPMIASTIFSALEIPAVWYEVGMHCINITAACTYDVAGFGIAGVPGIIAGHNNQIAWSVLPSSTTQTHQLFVLPLSDTNPPRYQMNGEWIDFDDDQVILGQAEDRDNPALTYTSYQSLQGAIISTLEGDYALALNWLPLSQPQDTISSLLRLNRADGWQNFQDVLADWRYPALDFVYADVEGNIASLTAGMSFSDPAPYPQVLTTARALSFDTEVRNSRLNPENGVLWTDGQNSSPLIDSRRERIDDLLSQREQHSIDSIAQILGDNRDLLMADVLPLLMVMEWNDPDLAEVQVWLGGWDGLNGEDSPQAAFWGVYLNLFLQRLFDNILYISPNLVQQERVLRHLPSLLEMPQHNMWDDRRTAQREGRDDILQDVFLDTYLMMREQYGRNIDNWQWGDIQQAEFFSRVIGYPDVLGNNLALRGGPFPINRDGYALAGGLTSVNRTWYLVNGIQDENANEEERQNSPFLQVLAANSFRLIIDLSDFSNSRAMYNTGQSGHPASDHYVDMITPWRTLEYHNLNWGLADVREASKRRLDLEPQP